MTQRVRFFSKKLMPVDALFSIIFLQVLQNLSAVQKPTEKLGAVAGTIIGLNPCGSVPAEKVSPCPAKPWLTNPAAIWL
jgi:hypothetical protein